MSLLSEKYGHRGACLLGLGVVWALFGISVMIDPQEPRPFVLHEMLPVWVRGALWISSGIVAAWFGSRGAQHDDTWGMVALVLLPIERLVSFAVSWLAWVLTSAAHNIWPSVEAQGFERGWYAAMLWGVIVVLLRIIAGWPNPRRVLTLPASGGDHA